MPKTLLAVDDSATMRRVLEITFSGEDFRVLTAEGTQSALSKLSEEPRVVIIDTVLANEDGYALCKEVRRRDPKAAIVLLSSRHNPYDAGKGRDAGADDYMDKPFDTQQMIDKVRKVVLAKEGGVAVAAAPSPQPPAVAPAHSPAPPAAQPRPAAPAYTPQAPMAAAAPAGKQAGRAHTLMFGEQPGGVTPPPAQAAPPPVQRAAPAPAPARQAPPVHATPPNVAPPAAAHVAASVNGHLASKLGELGLSPAQAEAVLSLSREVVERVVWEVVPQLAETLIKEEIARLMKE